MPSIPARGDAASIPSRSFEDLNPEPHRGTPRGLLARLSGIRVVKADSRGVLIARRDQSDHQTYMPVKHFPAYLLKYHELYAERLAAMDEVTVPLWLWDDLRVALIVGPHKPAKPEPVTQAAPLVAAVARARVAGTFDVAPLRELPVDYTARGEPVYAEPPYAVAAR